MCSSEVRGTLLFTTVVITGVPVLCSCCALNSCIVLIEDSRPFRLHESSVFHLSLLHFCPHHSSSRTQNPILSILLIHYHTSRPIARTNNNIKSRQWHLPAQVIATTLQATGALLTQTAEKLTLFRHDRRRS